MDEPTTKSHEGEHGVTYMDDVVPRRLVLRVLVATGVISVALCVIAYLLLVANERVLRPGRKFPERFLPAPHEVANVRQEPFAPATPASSIGDEERGLLRTYGWVDKRRRLVRIPVERAAELLLDRAQHEDGAQP